jgi:hypothetical protein
MDAENMDHTASREARETGRDGRELIRMNVLKPFQAYQRKNEKGDGPLRIVCEFVERTSHLARMIIVKALSWYRLLIYPAEFARAIVEI